MNTHSYFLAFIVTVFLTFSQAVMANPISEEMLNKIISNETYCVQEYDHDKIYLNSDNIYPTSDGLFLNLNGNEHLHIPLLCSDDRGCWVHAERIKILNDCPFCGKEYFVTCKNPNCPSKKKDK